MQLQSQQGVNLLATTNNTLTIFTYCIIACINSFDHPNGFDSGQIELYKRILYQHIDDNLKTQMAELCGSSLVGPHHEACEKIIKLFQLLPEDIIAKHVPILDAPKIDFKIGSAEVCSGFVEDLDFTFSLGISSLTVGTGITDSISFNNLS